jgi:DNA mismatch repair protein MutL
MPKVKVLPAELANKIAAGEVVERPASVVKELLENAIDAGSAVIGVEVLKGGRKLIRVADDGDGMEREDAVLSIQRHATSKLAHEKDLFGIQTMGFRGEALPSIASVSRMRLTTAPRGAAAGVTLRVEGGVVKEEKGAPARGTEVEVGELRLRSEGQETMNLPRASGLKERLAQVYGGEFMEGLAEAVIEAGGMRISAFLSAPGNFRDTRSNQNIFINRRPVRDPVVSHAVYSAYEGMLPKDKHPVFFVFLDLDPSVVDVNVHPAKREVRFSDRDFVYRHVRRCVSDAIRLRHPAGRGAETPEATPPDASHAPYPADYARVQGQAAGGVSETMPLSYRTEPPFVYLGETFLALAEDGGLSLLDHHAAHERVLYEKFLKGIELKSRRLLFPRQVRLSHKEYLAVLEHNRMLLDFGIEVEDFGHDTVVVRSLPEAMEEADLRGVLSDAAREMLGGEKPGRTLRESVAARMACHNSVRGRKVLTRETLNALVSDLEKTDDPAHCPHGRPTRVRYSLEELKKLFKRK